MRITQVVSFFLFLFLVACAPTQSESVAEVAVVPTISQPDPTVEIVSEALEVEATDVPPPTAIIEEVAVSEVAESTETKVVAKPQLIEFYTDW